MTNLFERSRFEDFSILNTYPIRYLPLVNEGDYIRTNTTYNLMSLKMMKSGRIKSNNNEVFNITVKKIKGVLQGDSIKISKLVDSFIHVNIKKENDESYNINKRCKVINPTPHNTKNIYIIVEREGCLKQNKIIVFLSRDEEVRESEEVEGEYIQLR